MDSLPVFSVTDNHNVYNAECVCKRCSSFLGLLESGMYLKLFINWYKTLSV